MNLEEKRNTVDFVCCLQHLQVLYLLFNNVLNHLLPFAFENGVTSMEYYFLILCFLFLKKDDRAYMLIGSVSSPFEIL